MRAKLPQYFRFAALGLLGLTVFLIVIGFYRSSGNPEFRMKGFPTSLSTDVVIGDDKVEAILLRPGDRLEAADAAVDAYNNFASVGFRLL